MDPKVPDPFGTFANHRFHMIRITAANTNELFWNALGTSQMLDMGFDEACIEKSQLNFYSGRVLTIVQESSDVVEVLTSMVNTFMQRWQAKLFLGSAVLFCEVDRLQNYVVPGQLPDSSASSGERAKHLEATIQNKDCLTYKSLHSCPRGCHTHVHVCIKMCVYRCMCTHCLRRTIIAQAEAALRSLEGKRSGADDCEVFFRAVVDFNPANTEVFASKIDGLCSFVEELPEDVIIEGVDRLRGLVEMMAFLAVGTLAANICPGFTASWNPFFSTDNVLTCNAALAAYARLPDQFWACVEDLPKVSVHRTTIENSNILVQLVTNHSDLQSNPDALPQDRSLLDFVTRLYLADDKTPPQSVLSQFLEGDDLTRVSQWARDCFTSDPFVQELKARCLRDVEPAIESLKSIMTGWMENSAAADVMNMPLARLTHLASMDMVGDQVALLDLLSALPGAETQKFEVHIFQLLIKYVQALAVFAQAYRTQERRQRSPSLDAVSHILKMRLAGIALGRLLAEPAVVNLVSTGQIGSSIGVSVDVRMMEETHALYRQLTSLIQAEWASDADSLVQMVDEKTPRFTTTILETLLEDAAHADLLASILELQTFTRCHNGHRIASTIREASKKIKAVTE